MAPICKGVKADGTEEDCKCDLCREEVMKDNNGYFINLQCNHHFGGHLRIQQISLTGMIFYV